MLFVVTGIVAGLILFSRYKLEGFKDLVHQRLEERFGADFAAFRVEAYGLRGVRIRDFSASFDVPAGPSVALKVPELLIEVDAVELLYGNLSIRRFQLNRADIRLSQAAESNWFATPLGDIAQAAGVGKHVAFRVTGRDCAVTIARGADQEPLELVHVDYDVTRLADQTEIRGHGGGQVAGASGNRLVTLDAAYTSPEVFSLSANLGGLTPGDITTYWPAFAQYAKAGTIGLGADLEAREERPLDVDIRIRFDALELAGLPLPATPVSGTVAVLGEFDRATQRLTLRKASTETADLALDAEGTIDLSPDSPILDLRLHSDHLPWEAAMGQWLPAEIQERGSLQLDLRERYAVDLSLAGAWPKPKITLQATSPAGAFHFEPKGRGAPRVDGEFSNLAVLWDSGTRNVSVQARISETAVEHTETGLSAHEVSGDVNVAGGAVELASAEAEIMGAAVRGNAAYSPASGAVTFAAEGSVADVQKALGSSIRFAGITGPADLRCNGTLSPKRIAIDLSANATQTEIGHSWWFNKPPGVGAGLQSLSIEIAPKKHMKISGTANIDAAAINGTLDFSHVDGAWQIDSARARCDSATIGTLNKILRIPYTATGGTASNIALDWRREPSGLEITGAIDHLTLVAAGADIPFILRGVEVSVDTVLANNHIEGALTLSVAEGEAPPLGKTWFVPMRPQDLEEAKRYPPIPSDWSYNIKAATLRLPPWQGKGFSGQAFSRPGASGINNFHASVDDGQIEGNYRFESGENISHLDAKWQQIPTSYLLQHLKFPEVLAGTVTGDIDYSVDHDDPGTLSGTGNFDVRDGRFSSDFLFSRFGDNVTAGLGGLSPSLRFTRLHSDLKLQGDRVQTDSLRFEAEGVTISGKGGVVIGGDMDYTLEVEMTPEVAQQIPALVQNFNLEGHRLTQNRIDLAFRLTGPAFAPTGAVASLPPIGVTLISGAAEVTSEAVKIIDIPRQILIDLFKIGGGIVGAAPGR